MASDWDRRTLEVLLFAEAQGQEPGSPEVDAVVVDLAEGSASRAGMAADDVIAQTLRGTSASDVIVRVGDAGSARLDGDIGAVLRADVSCVLVPGVEQEDDLAVVDHRLADAEAAGGIDRGTIRVLPILESPRAIIRAPALARAASARTLTLVLGCGDLSRSLGVRELRGGTDFVYARSVVALAAAAAGMRAPIDGAFLGEPEDLEQLGQDCRLSHALGFMGRAVKDARHIETVRDGYAA